LYCRVGGSEAFKKVVDEEKNVIGNDILDIMLTTRFFFFFFIKFLKL